MTHSSRSSNRETNATVPRRRLLLAAAIGTSVTAMYLATFWRPGGLSAEEIAEIETGIRRTLDDAFAKRDAKNDGGPIGVRGAVGCRPDATRVRRLVITRPGVYENYLVDGEWGSGNLLKISIGGVVVRNCEIRNGTHNAVAVYGEDVLIENCRIHHLLKGTFEEPKDAHGVTGRPQRLIVRNCEISQVSGDALQFDPDRGAWNDVLIDRCTLWTAPLTDDAGGYRRGDRPGENALDTKADEKNPRARIVVRNCDVYGWGNSGINNQAAFNLKENVDATVENCTVRDGDIAFRLRGDAGRGNADVSIRRCAIYDCEIGLRAENAVADLRIDGLGFGEGVPRKFLIDKGRLGPGFSFRNEFAAPPADFVKEHGVTAPTDGPELPPPITPRAPSRPRRR